MSEAPRRRLKVLVSAFACEPGIGSEQGKGWLWVKHIARLHEVWVITQKYHREPIERGLQQEPLPGVHWVYISLPGWMWCWNHVEVGSWLYYYLWQVRAYFEGRRLQNQVSFDLVHHVSFAIYWVPSFLAFLPLPFILGPVGGGESAPKIFYRTFGWRGWLHERLRDVARVLARLDPFVYLTVRRIRIALASTDQTAGRLRQLGARQVRTLSQIALPDEEYTTLSALPLCQNTPFRLVSIGNLTHWKGFHFGIEAFARFHRQFPASEYWIIGDGAEMARLQRLALRLGVADAVRFWGRLPRAQTWEKLGQCNVLVHPSFHDSGAWVVTEAMAAGRPVLCLDLGGPAVQVTPETGLKIPAVTPEQTVKAFSEAMLTLAQDPALCASMGQAAQRRILDEFHWSVRSQQIGALYAEATRAQTGLDEAARQ